MALKPLDISKHQDTSAPAVVQAFGIGTVTLRVAYGNFMDTRFTRFAAGCKAQGLHTGA